MKTFFDQFTPAQMKLQYSKNLQGLQKMQGKAQSTSKKVNGYTLSQLDELVNKFKILAR